MSQAKVQKGPGWEFHGFEDSASLAAGVAARFLDHVRSKKSLNSVALSGGRITEGLFREISAQPDAMKEVLGGLKYFWADERCVPLDSDASNYFLAERLLFRPLNVPESCQFPFSGGESPVSMADLGRAMLAEEVGSPGGDTPVFDLVFLGMGEDGHIASLFPENIASDRDRKESCYEVVASKPPPNRITLSYSVLSAAREVWLVISGGGKAAVLQEALRLEGETPIKHLLSSREQTHIFTDLSLSDQ